MKRVLFIAPDLSTTGGGGAERQIVNTGILLKEKGYDVAFLVYSQGNYFEQNLKDKGIRVHWLISKGVTQRLIGIKKFVRKGNYNVVISFLDTPNFINNFTALTGKKWKVVTSERSAKRSSFESFRGKVFGWFQRFADYIVCNSENAVQMWESYYPQYKGKVKAIYNHIKIDNVSSTYIPKNNNKTSIIIPSSYQYLKNPIGLINAVHMLDDEIKKQLKIDWFGNNITGNNNVVYEESLSLIKKYALDDIITLNPISNDIHNLINEYDFVGLFSKVEGLPNAICEGMVLSKPIIMSRVSDFNVLVDSSNGFLCDWDSTESIAQALKNVAILRKDEILAMGSSSKQKANILFDNNIDKWIELIES